MLRAFVFVSAAVLLSATLGASSAPVAPVRASAQELTLKGGQLSKLFTWADGASGPETNEYAPSDSPAPLTETAIDVGIVAPPVANAVCVPTITKAKGKVTSGGYLILEGSCFGSSGNVVLSGFPNGDPHATIGAWTPTAITVALPTISGVDDLTMHVKVTTGALTSKTIDAKYIAAFGSPVPLPKKYVVNNVCTLYGACAGAPHAPIGTHWDYTAQSGTDVWTLTMPEHFHLHAISLVHITSAPTKTTTINGGSSKTTFSVTWGELLNSSEPGATAKTITTSCSFNFGDYLVDYLTADAAQEALQGCSTTTTGGTPIQIPTYSNVYRVEATVVGPLGVMP